jgi:hypothetical protein
MTGQLRLLGINRSCAPQFLALSVSDPPSLAKSIFPRDRTQTLHLVFVFFKKICTTAANPTVRFRAPTRAETAMFFPVFQSKNQLPYLKRGRGLRLPYAAARETPASQHNTLISISSLLPPERRIRGKRARQPAIGPPVGGCFERQPMPRPDFGNIARLLFEAPVCLSRGNLLRSH